MEENKTHPYNTRSASGGDIKLLKKPIGTGKYSKPKYIVNVNKNSSKSENYKIIIGNLVDMSNKLLKQNENRLEKINFLTDANDGEDSDYVEEDKQNSSKYIKYSKREKDYFDNLDQVQKKKLSSLKNN